MDKVKYLLVMENILKDNFKTILSMDMGNLSGPMERYTKENGWIIKEVVKVLWYGPTEDFMKVNF